MNYSTMMNYNLTPNFFLALSKYRTVKYFNTAEQVFLSGTGFFSMHEAKHSSPGSWQS